MKSSEDPPKHTIRDPLIGATVDGRYLILSAIGQGATSSVYKAHDEEAGNNVALKIMHTHLSGDENLVARFQREAQTAKILTHPNIAAVHEYAVSEGGSPYLVMDFVEGISLQQLLAKDHWLPLSQAVPIFAQICAALHAAHQKEVIHRDLKPGNIMLLEQEKGKYVVKILDFGCAQILPMTSDTVLKVTQTGEMLGSLLYMSPEQCLDQEVDQRSDCYSLGCVLYETLTGTPPLAARTAFETMNKHMTVMPDSLSRTRPDLIFPSGLESVIFKAMAKSPAKRYQNVADFMDDLLKFADAETLKATESLSILPLPQSQIETGRYDTVVSKQSMQDIGAESEKSLPYLLFSLACVAAISMLIHSPLLFIVGVGICTILCEVTEFERKRRSLLRINDGLMIRPSPEPIVEQVRPFSASRRQLSAEDRHSSSFSKNKAEKSEILIYGAEASGNDEILLEVGTAYDTEPNVGSTLAERQKNGETKEVLVRPVDDQTQFWAILCDDIPYGQADTNFPLLALVIKRGSFDTMILIESHLCFVLPRLGIDN